MDNKRQSTRTRPKNEVDAVGIVIDSAFLNGHSNRFRTQYRKRRYAETRMKAAQIILALDKFRAKRSPLEKLKDRRNILENNFGLGAFKDGQTRMAIEEIDRQIAALTQRQP